MSFSRLTRFIALPAFALGLLIFLFGMLPIVAGSCWGPDEAARFGKLGKQLDWGIYAILVAAALGTLAEISISLRGSARSTRLGDS